MVRYHPCSSPTLFLFFKKFQLGVAMVAMVAMPREYTENDSRQMKLPTRRDYRDERADSPIFRDRSLIFTPKYAKADASFV